MARGEPRDLSSMRAFIDCSEPCRPDTLERFAARFASWGVRREMLQACYAMAETVFAVTQTLPGSPLRSRDGLLNLGRPIDGIDISIRDEDGLAASDGQFGEIALRGQFLLDGYCPHAARVKDGWFYTRDRGRRIDGALYVAGRLDDLLIVNGRKVHAHEIEETVDALGVTKPGRCIAFTERDERNGSDISIVVAECVAPDALSRPRQPIAE